MVKRQAGESSSQCAATNSNTPAHSSTPPSATASSTGQRRRSLDPCDSSNVRMRAAVPASTSPAETHRSSCFFSASAMPGPPLVSCFLPLHHHTEALRSKEIEQRGTPPATNILLRVTRSWRALLVHHQQAGFGVIRRRKIVKRHVNVFSFGLASFDQHVRDAFGNFSFLLRRPALHPGNLHVRPDPSSLERAAPELLHAKRRHSIRRPGSRKACA